jgi:hypothetical protein
LCAASLGQLSLVDGDGAEAAQRRASLQRSAPALWAWLPVEWRVGAEGAWTEERYALVNAAGRAECIPWLAGRWGWRAPDNRPAAGVSFADVTVRDVTTLFEHATRARRAAKFAAFVAEALSDAGECRTRVRRRCGCCRWPLPLHCRRRMRRCTWCYRSACHACWRLCGACRGRTA